ncbi:MAG: carboxypeptidase regulatory-like domain-containing protein [Planctomycetes bacterium]|nr:carboxypeptidase regulatory-like domain-containing protein [Planctomycetota bacterium]
MQRSLILALVVVLLGIAVGLFWFLRGEPVPMPATVDPTAAPTTAGTGTTAEAAAREGTEAGPGPREAVAGAGDLLEDPDIRAGLCGFKGRVVDHKKVPVGDCGVRIYRGALDSVLPANVDLLATSVDNPPQYLAGEVRTAADGTWQLTGVWPRAFYVLFAGIGTDAPTHQLVTKTPSPGEIVDLGDIVLNDAGVLTGTVVDDNGDPMQGALVRAADIPGAIAALFPIERIDPAGAVLVRESGSPIRVFEFPKWGKKVFEELPIPSTRTGADGTFRLVGVMPGSNMLAVTAPDFLSDVKPSVPVRAGQEKNVGTIRMKRGEELAGRVVDTKGEPVADAEVFAGSTSSVAPFDVAQRLARTDAQGRFGGHGFSGGKVTVAARRGPGQAWALAEPQPILGDVVVTLAATFAIDATIAHADGKPAKTVRMRLLHGRAGDGAAEMFLLGVSQPIELKDRCKETGEGKWRIENLAAGSYTLIADAPGQAVAFATFDVTDKDTSVALQLGNPVAFTVRVQSFDGKPIRNAAVYAEARGKRAIEMPTMCGRTGADGSLRVTTLQGDSLRVSADHPRWGTVHGEVAAGGEVSLVMQEPGALRGLVQENGKPPDPGKFTIVVERRGSSGPRGPLETVPLMLTAGLDGSFAAKALQPGEWRVQAIPALDALRSPGGVFALAQNAMQMRDTPRQTATVTSGQTTEVVLEAGEKPIEGPTATLTGSVTVDGRIGSGNLVSAHAKSFHRVVKVDAKGRFDFGRVPAGELRMSMSSGGEQSLFGAENSLWTARLTVAADEARELTIDVQTSSIRGICYDADGAPAAGMFVQGQGKLKAAEGKGDTVTIRVTTDAQGEFHFAQVAEGTWTLSANGNGGRRTDGRGSLTDIVTVAGSPVVGLRMQLARTFEVRGRVDLSTFANKQVEWTWMGATRLKEGDSDDAQGDYADGSGVNKSTGEFSLDGLLAGRYRIVLHVGFPQEGGKEYTCGVITVGDKDLRDVVLTPIPRAR